MGKWTLQHTEDVLLSKLKATIYDAIESFQREERPDDEVRAVSFMEFVEEFDSKDVFTLRLMEILVKEYSERRAKAVPVQRQLQIASRTSIALETITQDASVYDNSRAGRWPQRMRLSSSSRHLSSRRGDLDELRIRSEDLVLPHYEEQSPVQASLRDSRNGDSGSSLSSMAGLYEEPPRFRWRRSNSIRPGPSTRELGIWSSADEHVNHALASGLDLNPSTSNLLSRPSLNTTPTPRPPMLPPPRPLSMLPSPPDGLPTRPHGSGASLLRRNSLRRSYLSRISPLHQNRPQRRSLREHMNGHEPQMTATTSQNHEGFPMAGSERSSLETRNSLLQAESSSPESILMIPHYPPNPPLQSTAYLNYDPDSFAVYSGYTENNRGLLGSHSIVASGATQPGPITTTETNTSDSSVEAQLPFEDINNSMHSSSPGI
ncbi:hypothetical protein CPB86DRAFT_874904 [Serendipita vermifera]|nr:hypothetical protein CPB86DRAFT_874904 [Serendipita vermifera]